MSITEMDTLISKVKHDFSKRAAYYDEAPAFPQENFDQIVEMKLHNVNLPQSYGGCNFGIEQTCDLLVEIASACPSTALCLAMHYYSLGGYKSIFSIDLQDKIFNDISTNGHFMASISNPNVLFQYSKEDIKDLTSLHCRKVDGGYIVNGTKYFVSGCPRIKYLPIYCYLEDNEIKSYGMTALLSEMSIPGMTIEESWNYSGMRSTMSHTVHFNEVFIPNNFLIGREGYGIEDTQNLVYWFRLALVSVYYGIAKAAYDYIVEYIKHKKDPISKKALAFMPGIQFSIAEMLIKLETSSSQIKMCAKRADQEEANGQFTSELYTKTLITKQYVTKTANEVVWQAMQIRGTSSLVKGNLLERLYRDVRAAMFHPPAEDLLKEVIAKKTLGIMPIRNRWV